MESISKQEFNAKCQKIHSKHQENLIQKSNNSQETKQYLIQLLGKK